MVQGGILQTDSKILTAGAVVKEIKKCGITHVIWLPDSSSRFLYDDLLSEPQFTFVPVCREGEAIAIAAGLILGNKSPLVMQQNTGLFESGDSIRGLALDYKLPLLMFIGYKGWRQGSPMTDSVAIYTEPFIDSWGIKHYLVDNDEHADRISLGYREAHETQKPVAILIAKDRKEG